MKRYERWKQVNSEYIKWITKTKTTSQIISMWNVPYVVAISGAENKNHEVWDVVNGNIITMKY